jgi:ElaB/YqjD/DUF883 family membrane-anchored ribosome-binding protein
VTLERDDDIRLAEEDAVQADLRTDESLEGASVETAESLESMTDEEQAEAAEIRADIEQTRAEMGGTLNELGYRLEPGHLVDQAKENVREATIGRVEETTNMVMDTIRQNPIPAALAGVGLFMLWKNRSTAPTGYAGSTYRTYGFDRTEGYARPYGATGQGQWRGDGGQDIGSKARDAASNVRDNVGDAVGSAAETAQQAAGTAVERAGQTAQEVGWRVDNFMQANPLAVAVIAAGAGAVVGSIVPETEQEREMLGDASRQVSSAVREKVDEATAKAEETLDRAEEQVSSPA